MSSTADHERDGDRPVAPADAALPPASPVLADRDDQTSQASALAEPLARIASAMAHLDGLEHRPLTEHVAAFERVHLALTDALSAIDGV